VASQKNAVIVGTFVLAGVFIVIISLIWLGIADWFVQKHTYVTYFDVSVQGLNVDSDVKFRGVDIGKVKHIDVAPDGYLIEVRMEIEREFIAGDSLRAKLGMTGITGLKFIELNYVAKEKLGLYPAMSFETSHNFIPSYPGGFEEIEQSLKSIYDKLIMIDTEGISMRTNQFLNSGTALMTSADRVVGNADSVINSPVLTDWLVNLDHTIDKANQLISKVNIDKYDRQIDSSLAEIQRGSEYFCMMFETLENEAEGMRLNNRLDSLFANVNVLVEESRDIVNQSQFTTMQVLNSTNIAMTGLNTTIDELNSLIMTVKKYPSNLIYSAPPKSEK